MCSVDANTWSHTAAVRTERKAVGNCAVVVVDIGEWEEIDTTAEALEKVDMTAGALEKADTSAEASEGAGMTAEEVHMTAEAGMLAEGSYSWSGMEVDSKDMVLKWEPGYGLLQVLGSLAQLSHSA